MVKSLDPTRLVDSTTGWYDHGAGDFSVSISIADSTTRRAHTHYPRITTTTPTRSAVARSTRSNQALTTQRGSASKANSAVLATTSLSTSKCTPPSPSFPPPFQNPTTNTNQPLEGARSHQHHQPDLRVGPDNRHLELSRPHPPGPINRPDQAVCLQRWRLDPDYRCGGRGQRVDDL